jgi:hypothetical protein
VRLKKLSLSAVVVLIGVALLPVTERQATAWTYIQVVRGWYTGPPAPPPVANPPGRNPSYSVEGPVEHAAPPPPPPGPRKYRVILRDGTGMVARDQPKLVSGTVRFTDDRGGTLVAIKATLVDLGATAAVNQISWDARAAASPPGGAASAAAKPPAAGSATAAASAPVKAAGTPPR